MDRASFVHIPRDNHPAPIGGRDVAAKADELQWDFVAIHCPQAYSESCSRAPPQDAQAGAR
ncbi:MAG: hypothetical protein ACLQIH_07660 [Myxococcaceae bacterium]